MRQILLDTETTGLNPRDGHKITEIGCLVMQNRVLTGEKFHAYLNPERDIDEGAIRITGLTKEFLQDKPKFAEIAEEFVNFIVGAELIIHNAPFDLGFINHELNLLNHPIKKINEKVTVFDTLYHARKMYPGKKNNLDALCERLGVSNSHRQYHGALLDASILAEVYLAMTRGQTSFSWNKTNKQNSNQNNLKVASPHAIIHDLKVIYATETENNLHKKYLERMKVASKGHCIWSEE
jgi:DNA polymerase III subunit epsilon